MPLMAFLGVGIEVPSEEDVYAATLLAGPETLNSDAWSTGEASRPWSTTPGDSAPSGWWADEG